MNPCFFMGVITGVAAGIFLGLAFAAICFGVVAKVIMAAVIYRHDR